MDQEHLDAIKAANKRKSNCPTCGNSEVIVRPGNEVGGIPGIKYKYCSACGWTRAITHRQRKFKL